MPRTPDRQIEHLLRRAGFGARPDELDMYGQMSIPDAVDMLVNFEGVEDVVDSNIGKAGYVNVTTRGQFLPQGNITDARQRWLFRMVHSDRPLQEKMTLYTMRNSQRWRASVMFPCGRNCPRVVTLT